MRKILATFASLALVQNLHAQQLPETPVSDAHSGKKVAFNTIFEKEKVTLISFWATWCIPGKREVKTIVRNMAGWKKQADFSYIAIAVDQPYNGDLARTYAHAQGWNFPVYINASSSLKHSLNFQALPYVMIVDKKGNIVFTHTGYDDGRLILKKLKEFAGAGIK